MKENNKETNESWIIKIYTNILKLLKLETLTRHGRINLAGTFIVALVSILYGVSDWIKMAIMGTEDAFKTWVLKEDIYHPYESASIVEVILPTVLTFVICLGFIWMNENKKSKIRNKQN